MKNKAVIFTIICITIITLIIFGTYKFITNFKEDKEITKEKSNEIVQNFDLFNKSVQQFAKERDYFYNQRENTFLEEFAKNTKNWNDLIKDYQKSIENIEKNSTILKENCTVKFADPNINSKCTIFKSTYEAANNYYISDIKNYNKTVDEYNKWAKEKGENHLNKGNLTIYKDYIDYDKDKEYFGKEENNDPK